MTNKYKYIVIFCYILIDVLFWSYLGREIGYDTILSIPKNYLVIFILLLPGIAMPGVFALAFIIEDILIWLKILKEC